MLLYLLKFSLCLTVFLAFYKLLLERESIHMVKRFYLLLAVLSALIIPCLTFTTYVEPTVIVDSGFKSVKGTTSIVNTSTIVKTSIQYWPLILWSIYSIGRVRFWLSFSQKPSQYLKAN